MRTSTLRKLPVPFMVASGLGIGLVGFLMLRSSDEPASQQVAAKQTAATPTRLRPVTNRYRTGKPIAKLNRPGGSNYRPVQTSGAEVSRNQDAVVVAVDAYIPELRPAEVVARENAAIKNAAIKNAAIENAAIAAAKAATVEETPAQVAVDTTSPFRRDVDSIPTTAVADTTSDSTYSATNTDPSKLLSEVLGDDAPVVAEQIAVTEPAVRTEPMAPAKPVESVMELAQTETADATAGSIVMPPVDIEGPELAPEKPAEDESGPETNVVAGELQLDADAKAQQIVIQNPKDNTLPVWFVANRHKVQLKPGQKFVYPATEELEVRFARGGELGADKVVMLEGNWNFSVTRQAGWKLTQLN